tara:strand:- start:415 stop:681 length:267 start_codon:yes stop_codon:yes gene_type:complete
MENLVSEIKEFIQELGIDESEINEDLQLLGDGSKVKSRDLVEILLIIEDYLDEKHNVEFDWSSSNAMSDANSNYRNLGTLITHVKSLI